MTCLWTNVGQVLYLVLVENIWSGYKREVTVTKRRPLKYGVFIPGWSTIHAQHYTLSSGLVSKLCMDNSTGDTFTKEYRMIWARKRVADIWIPNYIRLGFSPYNNETYSMQQLYKITTHLYQHISNQVRCRIVACVFCTTFCILTGCARQRPLLYKNLELSKCSQLYMNYKTEIIINIIFCCRLRRRCFGGTVAVAMREKSKQNNRIRCNINKWLVVVQFSVSFRCKIIVKLLSLPAIVLTRMLGLLHFMVVNKKAELAP